MAGVVDTIFIALGLKTDGLEEGLAKTQAKLTGGIAGIAKGLAAPLTAGLSIGAIYKGLASLTSQMGAFSAATGVSVEDATAWSQAAVMMGGSADGFQGNLERLNMQLARIATTGKSRMLPFFEQLGVATTDDAGKARPVLDVFMDISKAIEGMPKMQSRGMLMNMGFDNATIKLLQSGSDNIQKLVEKERSYGVVTADTVKNMKDMNRSIKEMSYGIMMFFMPAFSRLMQISAKVFRAINFGFDSLRKNTQAAKGVAGALALIFSVKLVRAVKMFWTTLMRNPIMMVVAAIGMLILVLEDLWVYANGGQSALPGLWKKLFGSPEEARQKLEAFGQWFMNFMTAIGNFMDGAGGEIAKVLVEIGKLLIEFFSTMTGKATAAGIGIGVSFMKIAMFITKVAPAVKTAVTAFMAFVRVIKIIQILAGLLKVLQIGALIVAMAGGWVVLVISILMLFALLVQHWDEVVQVISEKFNALAAWFGEKVQAIGEWWNSLCESISQWWDGVCQSVVDAWNGAVGTIQAGINAVYNFFVSLAQGIRDVLGGVFDWLGEKFDAVMSMLPSLDSIGQKINSLYNNGQAAIGSGSTLGYEMGGSNFVGNSSRKSSFIVHDMNVYPKGNSFSTSPDDVKNAFSKILRNYGGGVRM